MLGSAFPGSRYRAESGHAGNRYHGSARDRVLSFAGARDISPEIAIGQDPPIDLPDERAPRAMADATTNPVLNPVRLSGAYERHAYLEVLVDGKSTDCLLGTGSEVTLIPGHLERGLRKRPVTLQIPAANGTLVEVLRLVQLPVLLQGKEILLEGMTSDHVAELLLWIDWLEVRAAIWDMRRGQLSMYGRVFPLKSKVDGFRVRRVLVQESVHGDWDLRVPAVTAAYRARQHEATGHSINSLLFGRELRAFVDGVLKPLFGEHHHASIVKRGQIEIKWDTTCGLG